MSLPAGIRWEKRTSALGKAYEVGTLANDPISARTQNRAPPSYTKEDFGMSVVWPVSENKWVDASSDVKSTAGISQYKLHSSGSPFFDYVLEFSNTEAYRYYFSDKTGDRYEVNAYNNKDQFVRFNSKKPTILFISGS